MASEKDANLAREQHSDFLRNLGAHGIAVDEVQRKGQKSFAVIAFFEEPPEDLPKKLEVKAGNQTREVPLLAKICERFKAE